MDRVMGCVCVVIFLPTGIFLLGTGIDHAFTRGTNLLDVTYRIVIGLAVCAVVIGVGLKTKTRERGRQLASQLPDLGIVHRKSPFR